MLAPPAMSTFPSPAAAFARSRALWMPSVTKVKAVPPSLTRAGRGPWVSTKDRRTKRRVVSPELLAQVVHRPAHDHRSDGIEPLAHELGAAVLLTSGKALTLPPARQVVHPAEERLGAIASRVVRGDTGAGQMAVEGDGRVRGHGHGGSS
ncbi:hypothetical protein ACFYQA_26445 [Streptomyces sp. NPDC005774]|uniref:hypothetical protein n=1 Tax=Streptomyces sp. NPDC005774 TaxID=3364728 RepID=UPI0036C52153